MTELIVLRLATRTLIHVPGLDEFQSPIRVVSEIGRVSYYLALVLLVCLLVVLVRAGGRPGTTTSPLLAAGLAVILLSAIAGQLGLIASTDMGWPTLAAILVLGAGVASAGWRTLPLLLLVVATWASGLAATLQGTGGGLAPESYRGLVRFGELATVSGCLLLPMMLDKPMSKRASIIGLWVAVVVTTMLSMASPTVTILILWSFGLPASLPAIAYGLAAGSFGAVLATAIQSSRRELAAGMLLLLAGGVGLVSTYQTALLAAGLYIATLGLSALRGRMQPSLALTGASVTTRDLALFKRDFVP